MIIGIAELLVNNQRMFSDLELERLMEGTLKIQPLGEIYRKIKVLDPISIRSKRLFLPHPPYITNSFVADLNDIAGTEKNLRKMMKVHTLALCSRETTPDMFGGVDQYGAHFGEGTFHMNNPFPQVIAHEVGHLLGLDHTHEEHDIMGVPAEILSEVRNFSPKNVREIKRNVSWIRHFL